MKMHENQKSIKGRMGKALITHLIWSSMFMTQISYGQTGSSVDVKNQQIEQTNKANLENNVQVAKDNEQHDEDALADGKPNATKCRTIHDAADDNYNMLVNYQQTYMNQNLEGLNNTISSLQNSTNSMVQAEGGLNGDPVSSMTITLDQYNQYRAELPAAEQRRNVAEANLQSAQNSLAQCNDDTFSCSSSERSARQAAVTSAQVEYNKADEEYKKIYNGIRSYRNQAVANSNQSVNNAYGDTANQEANSHSQFGVTLDGQLTGSGNATYNQLTAMYNATTASAQQLAYATVEKVRNQEMQAQYNADYRLYELAVDDFPPDDSYKYLNSASTFNKKRMVLSSMEVLGQTGAAAKDLACVKHKTSEGDSKAYYLFKAAAATYVSAEINDTKYHSNTTECRAYENFTEDDKDMQVRSVERAANIYDEIYEQLCLKINPVNATQAAECNKYLTEIYGDKFKDGTGNYMRTREKAIDILNLALDAAYTELKDKMQKVSTAHANVMKGEAWIKKDKQTIMTLTALLAVLYGVNSICPGCCGCVSPKISYVIAALDFYTAIDLVKAMKFTAEWKKKRDVARHYTHLVCNQDQGSASEISNLCKTQDGESYAKNEICMQVKSGVVPKVKDAFSEEDDIRAFADQTRQLAQEAVEKEKERVNSLLPADFVKKQQGTTFNVDPQLEKIVLKKVAASDSGYQASLSAYDWLRMKKGALSSLAYDDVLPPPEFIAEELEKVGIELKKTAIKGARSFAEVMFPEARAASDIVEDTTNKNKTISCSGSDQTGGKTDLVACSVGVIKGSTSFSYFLVRRNRGWQNQALDVTRSSARVPSPINYMSTTSGSLQTEISALPVENQTGMVVPETRINTIMNLIKTIQEHMALSMLAMDELYLQRQEYITLLDRMKRKLALGVQGVDDYQTITPEKRALSCMKSSGGEFQIDPKCSCKADNSCSTFSYPTFDGPGAVSSGSQMAFDLADASLSGNMEKANLAAGSLTNNAARVKSRLGDTIDLFNKNRADAGLPPIDELINQQRDAERQISYDSYANLSPSLSKFEEKKSQATSGFASASGSYADSLLKGAAADSSKDKSGDVAANPNTLGATGGIVDIKGSGKVSASGEPVDSMVDFDFKADGEDTIGNEFSGDLAGYANGGIDPFSGGANGGYNTSDLRSRSGGSGDSFFANNGGRNPASGANRRSQINENPKVSIFKIISRRYERSAYPVLLKRRAAAIP